ncbi:hypothetical protein D516_2685 [Rhodobacter sp. AKP1]|nr:hypothetical protein D516_2685 [Rhodobacter sp. AKP1]
MNGGRLEEKLGPADDAGVPAGALSYKAAVVAALEWGARQYAAIEARQEAGGGSSGQHTVRSAVEAYAKARTRRSGCNGKIAEGRLAKHVLSDQKIADIPLARLHAGAILEWRARLRGAGADGPEEAGAARLAPSGANRLMNDLRAALNAAYEAHRRELPAHLPAEIRIGTRAEPVTEQARQQLLADDMVRAAVEAAFEIEEDGHFGRLVMIAAATGARYSQLGALRVAHVQPALSRVLMPGSKKGRAPAAKAPVAVPLASDVLERLAPAFEGRAADDPLLMRWAYRNLGPFKWEKDRLRALGPAYEIDKQWAEVVRRARLPAGTIMYAFRHSSIVRGLRAGLPVRLVASLHDTSTAMIEKHYAAFIVDMTEDLARRATLSLG